MQNLKVLEDYAREIEPRLKSHRSTVIQQLQALDQECGNKYSFNEDKYVDCIKKLNKRVDRHTKHLEFGLLFWKHHTYLCFEQQTQNSQSFNVCKERQNKQLDDILNKFQL